MNTQLKPGTPAARQAVRDLAAKRIALSIVARHIRANKDISTLSPLEEAQLAIWRLEAGDVELAGAYLTQYMDTFSRVDLEKMDDTEKDELVHALRSIPGHEANRRVQEAKRLITRATNMLDATDETKREVVNILATRNASHVDVIALVAL